MIFNMVVDVVIIMYANDIYSIVGYKWKTKHMDNFVLLHQIWLGVLSGIYGDIHSGSNSDIPISSLNAAKRG